MCQRSSVSFLFGKLHVTVFDKHQWFYAAIHFFLFLKQMFIRITEISSGDSSCEVRKRFLANASDSACSLFHSLFFKLEMSVFLRIYQVTFSADLVKHTFIYTEIRAWSEVERVLIGYTFVLGPLYLCPFT